MQGRVEGVKGRDRLYEREGEGEAVKLEGDERRERGGAGE